MTLDTPVLLLAWRRPDATRQVIDAIRAVKPAQMFVACDGPNPERSGESAKVTATREVIEREIDWPCTIARRYSEVNQGCKIGVSSAITWFFEQVEEGIILEDDCVPHPDFFYFCSSLLNFYRDDSRVWTITGNNFQNGQRHGDASYFFSKYNHIWGWATWRRAWRHYQVDIPFWPTWKRSKDWQDMMLSVKEKYTWEVNFDEVYENILDTWDYQWTACIWYQKGLTATPNINLVSNIGYGVDATHTVLESGGGIENLPSTPLGKLIHPHDVIRNRKAEKTSYMNRYGGKYLKNKSILCLKIKEKATLPWVKYTLKSLLHYLIRP